MADANIFPVLIPSLPAASAITGDEQVPVWKDNRLVRIRQDDLRGSRMFTGATAPPSTLGGLADLGHAKINDRYRNTTTGDEFKLTATAPVTWTPDGNLSGSGFKSAYTQEVNGSSHLFLVRDDDSVVDTGAITVTIAFPDGGCNGSTGGGSGGGFLVFNYSVAAGTLTAGQTVFPISGGYISTGLMVFVDGVKLTQGTDFVASDGETVAIINPAIEATDYVDIIVSGGDGTPPGPVGDGSNLPNIGTAATYGDATHIPRFTTDSKGRVVSVQLVAITPAGLTSVPTPSPSTLGGVFSSVSTTGQFVKGLDPTGALIYDSITGSGGGTSGNVTSVAASSTDLTITGSPITTSGTLGFSIADKAVTLAKMADVPTRGIFGNVTGTPGTPAFNSLSQHLDTLANTAGSMIARGTSAWTILPSGTSGQVLTSQGTTGVPIWQNSSTTTLADGSVTLAKLANVTSRGIIGNVTGTTGAPTFNSLSQHLDTLANTPGTMVARSGSQWVNIGAGGSGQVLTSQGGADVPTWQTPASSGGGAAVTATRLSYVGDWAANQMYSENGAAVAEKWQGAVATGFGSTNATSITAVRMRYEQYLYNGAWYTAAYV